MKITTLTSREFNQDVSKAKRDAAMGPIFITDRGRTAHVLLTIEDSQDHRRTLITHAMRDLLPPRLDDTADLS